MSKLSTAIGRTFDRHARDFYRTIDRRCLAALLFHIQPGLVYAEPMAGDGALVHLLDSAGLVCEWATDIEPQCHSVGKQDALTLSRADLQAMGSEAECFITNPPWKRTQGELHRFIVHLASIMPVWMLFDADWVNTVQAVPYLERWCTDIQPIGRLKWFPPKGRLLRLPDETDESYKKRMAKNKPNDPQNDFSWYRFASDKTETTRFWPRVTASDERQGKLI